MSTMTSTERIQITERTIEHARATRVEHGASLVLRLPDGRDVELPDSIQHTLLQALSAIATSGSVSIDQVPDELTSTVAADMLGVTRPTLIKWARDGVIASHHVGSHTRFLRDDVYRLREQRMVERQEAFDKLRALDLEHEELLDD